MTGTHAVPAAFVHGPAHHPCRRPGAGRDQDRDARLAGGGRRGRCIPRRAPARRRRARRGDGDRERRRDAGAGLGRGRPAPPADGGPRHRRPRRGRPPARHAGGDRTSTRCSTRLAPSATPVPSACSSSAGYLRGRDAVDVLVGPEGEGVVAAPWVDTPHTHGAGCALSSAVAALRPGCETWPEAVLEAKQWLSAAIRAAADLRVGRGCGPVHHLSAVWGAVDASSDRDADAARSPLTGRGRVRSRLPRQRAARRPRSCGSRRRGCASSPAVPGSVPRSRAAATVLAPGVGPPRSTTAARRA